MIAQIKAAPGLRKLRDGRACLSCRVPLEADDDSLCGQCAGLVQLYDSLRAVRGAMGWRS